MNKFQSKIERIRERCYSMIPKTGNPDDEYDLSLDFSPAHRNYLLCCDRIVDLKSKGDGAKGLMTIQTIESRFMRTIPEEELLSYFEEAVRHSLEHLQNDKILSREFLERYRRPLGFITPQGYIRAEEDAECPTCGQKLEAAHA